MSLKAQNRCEPKTDKFLSRFTNETAERKKQFSVVVISASRKFIKLKVFLRALLCAFFPPSTLVIFKLLALWLVGPSFAS